MFESQLKIWKSHLDKPDIEDEDRDRISKHIERLQAHSDLAAMSGGADIVSYPSGGRRPGSEAFKGQTAARLIKCRAVAAMDNIPFAEAATQIYGSTIGGLIVKAANPVDTSDAAGLVGPAAQDLIDLIRPGSVYDSLPLRHVKAHLPIARILSGTTGYWVAEGAKITQSKLTTERFTLTPLKVGALVPLTIETVRDSSPSADREVSQDITHALRKVVDETFVGTADATTGTPAGLLHGVTPVVSSGDEAEDLVADVKGLLTQFPRDLRHLVELVMGPELALDIATMRSTLNVPVFPQMTATGGTLEGLKVYVTSGVPAGRLIALVSSEIYRVHDTPVEIAISRDATIDGTNLFENALIGVRGLRSVNWAARRDDMVSYIEGAAYGAAASPTAS
jgi:HK97 family phage major capsid protein